MSEMFGRGPAGDESPEEYTSNDQTAGQSPDTGTSYDQTGEPESTPHDRELAGTDQSDADPNAASSSGLGGDLGHSSERTGPADETGDPV